MKDEAPSIEAVDRNIATIHRMRKSSDEKRTPDQKAIDRIAHFAGTPYFLYAHGALYAFLLVVEKQVQNVGLIASLEAIFLSVFVLINQKRMNALERKNADLHLQMSLLSEHELTRLARVTDLIAKRLGVDAPEVNDLEDVKKDVQPADILKRISEHEKNSPTDSTSDNMQKN